jgi:hypothetical protein
MKNGHLYRYPHPHDATKFIYSGQGSKRDGDHRSGRSSFGRRFKREFPGTELPQPIRETVEVKDQLELNELETISMFRYHTWYGYDGGMNLTLPGSSDYKSLGVVGNREGKRKSGLRAFKTGQLASAGLQTRFSPGRQMSEQEKERVTRLILSAGEKTRFKLGVKHSEEMREKRSKALKSVVYSVERKANLVRTAYKGGRITNCLRWNIRRGKACTCGKH